MKMWWMHAGYWSPKFCASIIERAAALPVAPATVGFGAEHRPDATVRRSTVRWITRETGQAFSDVWLSVEAFVRGANRAAFGLDIAAIHELQIAEYDADVAGYYDWHTDVNWEARYSQRKLSFVAQLSDPATYEGGDLSIDVLHLERPNTAALRQQGSVICFPSFLRHRAETVTKGKRWSLVAWAEGAPLR